MAETETLCNGRWLRLCRRGTWEFVERTNPAGAVIIIAVTPDDRLLFVEQWREAIRCKTIEMPAGLIGDTAGQDAEDALQAARRELLEETGYDCARLDFYMRGPSSAGMSTEMMSFVHAQGLTRVHAGGGDGTENIVVHEVPRTRAGAWLAGKLAEGYSIDPKMFAGLYLLEHGAALFGSGS